MKTKTTCLLFVFSASFAAFGLTDVYWVGGTSGDWGTASNWSGEAVPNSADCHVHITNEVSVTISLSSANSTVGGLSFSGANHVINGSKHLVFGVESSSDAAPTINVAEGIAASVAYVKPSTDNGCGLVKAGGGALVSTSNFGDAWNKFSFFDVQVGVYSNVFANGDTFRVGGRVYVRSGAKVAFSQNNTIENSVVFELEKDAIFDNCWKRDSLGGVTGEGVVTNLSTTASNWNAGPLDLAGRVYGSVTLSPATDKVVGDEGYLRVGASNTLANATIGIDPGGSYTNVLRFAPGVGSFYLNQLNFTKLLPIVLEDTDGGPITLTTGFGTDNYKNAAFVGCGNFIKSNGYKWIITNDLYSATGMLGVKAGTIEAGTGAEGFDAALNISRLDVGSGATFSLKNFADTTWDAAVTGAGTVSPTGQGVWTLNNFSMTNGSLAVVAPATGLVLSDGVATNVAYSIGPTTFKTTITGGDYDFSGVLNVSADRTVEQTGGSLRCCLQANSSSCSNDIFYTITGGSLVSYATKAKNNYPQGVGMDISGDAHVELRNQSGWPHRLESGSASHTIRLSGSAYLGIDDMLIVGEYTSTGTAVLDLQGGVMEVKGNFSEPAGGTITSAEGRILFNGGLLRAAGAGNQTWWGASADPNERVKAYIGAAGAFIDVKALAHDRVLRIDWPFVSGVTGGVDGGLVKLGLGQLRLLKPYAATGLVDVREGSVQTLADAGATPFGTAGVRIGCGYLKFAGNTASVGAASGASLSYANCATLALSGGSALTLGAAGSEADSAIAREGHGVLLVMSGTANSALGANATLTVNGGLSNDATTGILRQPVFERRQVTGSVNQYRARFLTCDGNGALLPAAPVEFNPAASDSSTVAQITADAVTVSANASVGALSVELSKKGNGLTVDSGVTLSVGSGSAGSVAPILLNNHVTGASLGDQTGISGAGTIDFGASEGVIVVNGNGGLQNPVQIDTALAGSGGVTFAAPMLFAAGYRGYIALSKAGSYTGGTWIENVHVSARAEGCFGNGTIHVSGSELEGGALEIAPTYNSNAFDNPIVLAGNGPAYPADYGGMPGYFGALIVRKGGVTFSGGVTLVSDTKFASGSRSGQKPIVFSAPITGQGGVTVSGTSPFRFAAANTYAGGTIITNGTVEVADLGTLGSGPVKVCAGGVLRFVNTSAKMVSNVITGDGRLEMNGAAVTLTAADGFTGDVIGAGSASGDNGYVKSGEGTVSFTNSLDYTGATTVEGGTLRLGLAPIDVPPAVESMAFHLDADAGDTITEEGGVVVAWVDADGRDIAFTNVVENGPSRAVGALNEKDAFHFDGEIKRRLIANAATPELRTVFFVNRVATTHKYGWSNMGILGMLNNDRGLRFLDRNNIKADSLFLDGVIHVDGASSMTASAQYDYMAVPNNKFVVTEAEVAVPVRNVVFALGDYWGHTTNKRAYSGDIAEVIAYDRWLSDDERIAAERYLQSKWGLKDVSNDVFTNVLPVATALTVADGATLDLAGGYQEVASLSGAGTVANSASSRATLVLSSGTSEFSGSFSGDIYLEVAAGATLDLCGGTITVGGVGGSGRICNGTVVVTGEIQPGGRGAVGTLTFESAPVVAAGATLVVDGDGAGGVDKLAVEGAFDMTGLSLSVPAPKSVAPGDHVVVESGVALSGEFYATDLPDNGRWSVGYTARAAVLSRKAGLIMIMR